MFDQLLHRWLRVPYTLHVYYVRKPKRARATILFIHGIGNSGKAWEKVIAELPKDIAIVAVDLLGFGDSPKPDWALYNAKTQARSVLATCLAQGIIGPLIVVGHSLGSLVAIEMAKRYPLMIRSLILCSPPLYQQPRNVKFSLRADDVLRQLYVAVTQSPKELLSWSAVAMKYNLINDSFNVTDKNVASYIETLQAMIINQTSLHDAKKVKVPMTIIQGALDPLVVTKNLKELMKSRENVRHVSVLAGHEVKGPFVKTVVKMVEEEISQDA